MDASAELGKGLIPGLGAGSDELLGCWVAVWGAVGAGEVEGISQVWASLDVELASLDAEEAEGQGDVVARGQGLLAHLAGGPEGQAVGGGEVWGRSGSQEVVGQERLVVGGLVVGDRVGAEAIDADEEGVVQAGLLELDEFDQGTDLTGAKDEAELVLVTGRGELGGGASGIDG